MTVKFIPWTTYKKRQLQDKRGEYIHMKKLLEHGFAFLGTYYGMEGETVGQIVRRVVEERQFKQDVFVYGSPGKGTVSIYGK